MESEVTNGELYRLMVSHGETLKEIKGDVKTQNSRVSKLEAEIVRIKAYWSAGALVFAVLGNYLKAKLGF